MKNQRIVVRGLVGVLMTAVVGLGVVPAGAQGARKLEITFGDGLVTLVAENVTVREILAEWARKGGSRIVNAEKLGGSPVPLTEFRNQPEVEVLRSLLRDAPGYGAATRLAPDAGVSSIETVFILATRSVPVSSSPAPVAAPAASQIPNQQFQPPPQAAPRIIDGSPDNEILPVRPIAGELPPMIPGTPAPVNPTLRTGPGGTVTSTIPGVVIPPPTPPAGGGAATPPTGGRGRGGGGGGRS